MTILDAQLQLSAAQAVTASAVSTNTIDLGTSRDIGAGTQLFAVVGVDTTATAATVRFQVITSANANLSSANVISQTDDIPIANLTAGRKPIVIALSPAVLNSLPVGQRYLGLQYTIGTGPLTAGAFTAYLTNSGVDVGKNYASGFTVA